ncbi:MAG: hypothetical protein IJJ51_03310 [Kiritimatiellae bacterium]|nr:hypothetical protein [Kiritimatiellia bacterium]
MMAADKAERIKSIIGWMRKNITLSLEGYRPGWDRASKFSIGSSLPFDGDTSAPSIGRIGGWSDGATVRPCLRRVKLTQDLPPAASRDVKKIPDLKRENPSFAAMLVKYVNERFGGDAPKVYNAAHVSRKTYSAIAGNELRPVSKAIAVQFALALQLTHTEADAILKAAGYAFSPAILEDIIICACIEEKVYDIADVNSLLLEYNAKPFAVKEDA